MRVFITLCSVLVGIIVGYFIGYDHGFEASTESIKPQTREQTTESDAAHMMSLIIGEWQSIEDQKFTREIRNDGVVIDRYEGQSPQREGVWLVFTKNIPDIFYTGEYEDGAVYLSMTMSETERLYFKIINVTEEALDLVYLDGGTLSFRKID